MTPLIERNTTIPSQKKQVFSTASDNQPAVTIVVLQGERPMAKDNKEIGRFDLTDIPPAPRGMPQIEVAFDIDADGILHVSAKDKQSGKEQKIRIEAKSGLTDAEIQRKVKEAELHAAEDKERKEAVEVRNEADALAFRAQKSLQRIQRQASREHRLRYPKPHRRREKSARRARYTPSSRRRPPNCKNTCRRSAKSSPKRDKQARKALLARRLLLKEPSLLSPISKTPR